MGLLLVRVVVAAAARAGAYRHGIRAAEAGAPAGMLERLPLARSTRCTWCGWMAARCWWRLAAGCALLESVRGRRCQGESV